jgi:NAD(P)-dependent dehydrogenase (short-subunit alcohol dehydrogenase family)
VTGRLEGKRALLTGATGGIGPVIARAFAAEGARVALVSRTRERLEALCAELGACAVALRGDVAEAEDVAAAVSEAARALGALDVVVNAAAIDTSWHPVGELPVEEWNRAVAVNLSGTFYVCRAALPHLEAGGGGAIVNVTSVAGLRAWAEDAAYNASKAGVELLTRTIAVDYGRRGVRANCLALGIIDAGMTDEIIDPAEREALLDRQPAGRMGRPEEVAEAVVWLASDASAFTTGTTLVVDGGFLA